MCRLVHWHFGAWVFYVALVLKIDVNGQTVSFTTTPAPVSIDACDSVFHNSSLEFSNPRGGQISALTLVFTSDVGFNRSDKIVLKLPGFTRVGGSAQVLYATGTAGDGGSGAPVAVGQAGGADIVCFTSAQWDEPAEQLTLTHVLRLPVPPRLRVAVALALEANMVLPTHGLLPDTLSGVLLRRRAAAVPAAECAWTKVDRDRLPHRTGSLKPTTLQLIELIGLLSLD
jgi:hypothetical protein